MSDNILHTNQGVSEQIQQHIVQAQRHIDLPPVSPPNVTFPGKPADIPYDVLLYQHLSEAQTLAPAFDRDIFLSDAAAAHWPLIGRLIQKFRRGLHEIALFYTNRALKHQLQVNRHLTESVGRLTAVTQQQQRLIQSLQADVDALKSAQK